jgi:hypothetical protein
MNDFENYLRETFKTGNIVAGLAVGEKPHIQSEVFKIGNGDAFVQYVAINDIIHQAENQSNFQTPDPKQRSLYKVQWGYWC